MPVLGSYRTRRFLPDLNFRRAHSNIEPVRAAAQVNSREEERKSFNLSIAPGLSAVSSSCHASVGCDFDAWFLKQLMAAVARGLCGTFWPRIRRPRPNPWKLPLRLFALSTGGFPSDQTGPLRKDLRHAFDRGLNVARTNGHCMSVPFSSLLPALDSTSRSLPQP